MQYLLFGSLLLLGAIVFTFFVWREQKNNQIEGTIMDSSFHMEKEENQMKEMSLSHTIKLPILHQKDTDSSDRDLPNKLETNFEEVKPDWEIESIEKNDNEEIIETNLLSVRYPKGTVIKLYQDKKTKEVYFTSNRMFLPFVLGLVLAGSFCFLQYSLMMSGWEGKLSGKEWLAVFLGITGVVMLCRIFPILQSSVIRMNASFEGFFFDEEGEGKKAHTGMLEIYSVWYGEYKQYGRRRSGLKLKTGTEPIKVFYHTQTGEIYRYPDIFLAICVSAVNFLALVLLLLI